MISKLLASTAIVALALAVAPASAKMASCTTKNLDKTNAMLTKMPDSDAKTTGMTEISAAKDAMGQKDMKGCMSHLDAAMKAGMSKPKPS